MRSPIKLGTKAKTHFNAIVKHLEKYEKLESVDLLGIAQCAVFLEKFEVASKHIEEHGEYNFGGSRWWRNPALQDLETFSKGFRSFIKEFAMSPAARKDLKAVVPEADSLLSNLEETYET